MTAVLVPMLTAGSVVIAAIATPFVGGIMQARIGDRLRAAVTANFELADKLRALDPAQWQQEIDDIEGLLRRQVLQIKERDEAELNRRRDWSALLVLAFILAIGGLLLWLFYRLDQWWSWALYWLLALFLLAMTAAAFDRALHPPAPAPSNTDPAPSRQNAA
ncbi:hypothetical protein [Streptomyces californicus]|uniref:hypothetical protein n=1 Tax=Streptomyces californicus TaxID=67351 RepID=UPI00296E3628|nr:hypothetical protein [Streptomyces californicus]MDW4899557.1 hypothetical protein [Streptomyces californicus]